MRKIILAVFLVLPMAAFAQSPIWTDLNSGSGATATAAAAAAAATRPASFRALALNRAALVRTLSRAPMEFTAAAKTRNVIVPIPMPDGSIARFRVQVSPISLPDPSGKRSNFKSYSGQGIDDRTATVRFDISPAGFHAQILSAGETVYVDPFSPKDTERCMSYFKKDLQSFKGRPECSALPSSLTLPSQSRQTSAEGAVAAAAISGTQLHKYRTAIAATGEYTTYFTTTYGQPSDDPTQRKDRALLAIKKTMNRVNGIWEREAAIRYVLLADVDEFKIIYLDGATDPYTNSDAGTMIPENQSNLDTVIGDANYDVGHVFATSSGGVGAAGVCETGRKAAGVTGLPAPEGDPFDVDFVAHEIIHQWGGNHTFNSTGGGGCTVANRTAPAAYEPGSGSTLASYAGTCNDQDLQANSDDYFHGISLDEINNYRAASGGCAVSTATGNTPPAVSAPTSFTIPSNTPFTLTASATDVDGDALTYGWEEFDLGDSSPPETDNGNRPILRPYKPITTGSRTFPSLQYILNNANVPPATYTINGKAYLTGETLPVTMRTMNFRVTVRDNRVNGGGVSNATTAVNVRSDSGPFAVTVPNTAVTFTGDSTVNVTWSVANTNLAPVSTANVKISLSTDGGMTFPTILAASTPNDGSENVPLPNVSTTVGRIKVEAVDNIYFDISDANFTINATAATVQFGAATESVNESAGSITLAVTRTGDTSGTTTVNYATGGGTATAGTDYTPESGQLTFAPSETSKEIMVPIINDTAVEGNETFVATLNPPPAPGAAARRISTTSAEPVPVTQETVTIIDNDVAPTAPVPSNAVSRKMHGTYAGLIDLPRTGTPGVECRSGGAGGNHQVLVEFAGPVTVGGVSVTSTDSLATATQSVSGGVVTVELAGVSNAQVLNITLTNVADGNGAVGDVTIPIAVLLGDTTRNGSVNSSDISQTKSESGKAVDATNFQTDVTVNNAINSSDIALVKSKSGTALPVTP